MKLIVDIPDEMYNMFQRGVWSVTYDEKKIRDIVLKGIPLKVDNITVKQILNSTYGMMKGEQNET